MLMLLLIAVSWWLRLRRRLFDTRWFLLGCTAATPLGFLAVLAGWITTEVGRQPWTVYGVMRTAESVSPSLTGRDVLISLLGYAIVYLIMFPAGGALLARIVKRGPTTEQHAPVEGGRAREAVTATPQVTEKPPLGAGGHS